jgi:hypothetical protein
MALSKSGLTKALKKYRAMLDEGKTLDDITTELQVDDNGYEADEMKQIIDGLGLGEGDADNADKADKTQQPPIEQPKPAAKENPLAELAEIDYKQLSTKKEFRKYAELVGDRSLFDIDETSGKPVPVVGKLRQNDEYVFELYKAKPVRKERFPGMKNSPIDFVGVEILRDTPEHQTKITVGIALEYNSQILNAHSIAGYGKYYLLKRNQ